MNAIVARFTRMRAIAAMGPNARAEEGIALLTAILFMIMMAGLSVVLVSVVLAQTVPSNIAQKGTKTIYAAQAGMQAALAVIRAAGTVDPSSGKTYGDPTKLPCTVTGNANAQSDGTTYTATLKYFIGDPTQPNATAVSCPMSATTQPTYATILSLGVANGIPGLAASVANRSMSAVYKFSVTNLNIAGGRIYDYNKAYCLDAVTATAGSLVRFLAAASCTNDALELWAYDTDYEIKLASTTVGGAAGLCITGPVNYGDTTQNATLQLCKAKTDALRWNQLWSWTGSNSWQGENINISAGYSGFCLATNGTALTGKYLLVSAGCNGGFAPTTQVGAGAASYKTSQIVNYKEFGRCADVTNQDINFAFMISYPCKQDPTGTGNNLLWNHKWYYSEPTLPATSLGGQQIYVNNGTKYCLTTPAAGGGSYPIFALCNNSSRQNWTRVNNTGTYASSYLFVDTNGLCLTADSTDVYSNLWSKIIVDDCNGSTAQKWNAPPTDSGSTVASFKEVAP